MKTKKITKTIKVDKDFLTLIATKVESLAKEVKHIKKFQEIKEKTIKPEKETPKVGINQLTKTIHYPITVNLLHKGSDPTKNRIKGMEFGKRLSMLMAQYEIVQVSASIQLTGKIN